MLTHPRFEGIANISNGNSGLRFLQTVDQQSFSMTSGMSGTKARVLLMGKMQAILRIGHF